MKNRQHIQNGGFKKKKKKSSLEYSYLNASKIDSKGSSGLGLACYCLGYYRYIVIS